MVHIKLPRVFELKAGLAGLNHERMCLERQNMTQSETGEQDRRRLKGNGAIAPILSC
jgi:hypothetical protein